jgi:hypothetical protein
MPTLHWRAEFPVIKPHVVSAYLPKNGTATKSGYLTYAIQTSSHHPPYFLLYSPINPLNLPEAAGVVKFPHQVSPR